MRAIVERESRTSSRECKQKEQNEMEVGGEGVAAGMVGNSRTGGGGSK